MKTTGIEVNSLSKGGDGAGSKGGMESAKESDRKNANSLDERKRVYDRRTKAI